jgi:hypothetical protein
VATATMPRPETGPLSASGSSAISAALDSGADPHGAPVGAAETSLYRQTAPTPTVFGKREAPRATRSKKVKATDIG